MAQLSELGAVEQPVTNWLTQLGWTYCSPADLKKHHRPLTNPIIEPILLAKVVQLNGVSETVARTVVEQLTQHLSHNTPLAGNERFLDKLVKGVTINIDGDDRDFRFIDFDNIWNNDFTVTNQYRVQGSKEVITDIVLLVNGIPLVPIEAKQRARKGTNWLEGVKQFSTYDQRADKLFMVHAFGVACNGRIAKYGIPGASSSYYAEWKDTTIDTTHDNPLLAPTSTLCRTRQDPQTRQWHFEVETLPNGEVLERMKLAIVGLLQPARVLDILKNFLVFERSPSKVHKKVARYQQLRAANKIVQRVMDTNLRQGVIWHTQGSGKSLTMLYTAAKLRQTEGLNDPTVYIVVDRKDLREQIGGTFDDCEFPNARSVYNIGDLKHIIDTAPAGVFITTIQKFRELGSRQDLRDNIVILIDEAHRTQYGDFQIELQNVLPNARRFAFTGTPIPKTHQEFGVAEETGRYEHYLDRYSIQDAIDDGATVPIRYTFGPQEWFLDKDKLKQGFDEITADLTDDERQAVEKRVQAWKVFLKHPDRIGTLAKDIANDFRTVVEPQGYKAQLVACDKEACVLYFNELLPYFDRSEIAIIFSEGQYDEGERYELFKDHNKDDHERRKLIARFKRRITEDEQKQGNNLKIFIVCNMLLTGFDAPIEQTMYLDSPLRDHNLLQAVARTNRPYDDKVSGLSKQYGRIVDYVGVFENYKESLNYDPEDIGEFEDVDSLVEQFPSILEKAFKPFAGIMLEDTYDCTMAIVRVLNQIDHGKFEGSYREVVQLWEAISPHPKLRDHRDRYRWLSTIYELYLEEFKRLDFDAEIYAAKTRQLIQESTTLLDFRGHLPEIKIDSDYLNQLKATKLSPSDKAEKIIRDIETVIRQNEVSSAVYVEFQNRLDELIRQKQAESQAIEQLLLKLGELYSELDNVISLPKRMGFADKGTFEIFMTLRNAQQEEFNEQLARDFAQRVADTVIRKRIYIGWQEIPNEVKRMRLAIQVFAASDEFDSLGLDTDEPLLEMVMKRVIQEYSAT
ncbi:type I restriction endonuclease subunit R [Spirosoma areae]